MLHAFTCHNTPQEMLGTNPIAFGAPGENGDDFMLDMATTAVAVGKVCCHNLGVC